MFHVEMFATGIKLSRTIEALFRAYLGVKVTCELLKINGSRSSSN